MATDEQQRAAQRQRAQIEAAVQSILESAELDNNAKIARLRQMSYDCRELEVAGEEGMTGFGSNLDVISRALAELGADDQASGAKQ